MNIICKKR